MPWEEKRETRRLADALATPGAERVILHDVIAPNFGDLSMRLDEMEQTADTGEVSAFKVYTAWGPNRQGYALDDPAIGIPVVEKARDLGITTICGHKGLPLLEFDRSHNDPRDMVAMSRMFPDMDFVIYHGAWERETRERAYDPGAARAGVDSLVRALAEFGVGPNENVYAELGTTWREVLSRPDEAAHVLGKLLRYVGEDNVLWGTDAVWYGSPQPQIMAFRAFQIGEDYQEQFGYPALTDELKRKVFGLNAAGLFGVDVNDTRCAMDADQLATARLEHASLVDEGAITTPWQARGPMSRREVLSWLRALRQPWTP
jgi:predicted TIM-barrel fold metal-dependent hydrolase